MHHFMIDVSLPEMLTEEFLGLIPQQRKQVNRMFREGRLSSYGLALDRSKIWATMLAESEEEVIYILSTFPLRKFMEVKIHRLAFYENAGANVAHISMN